MKLEDIDSNGLKRYVDGLIQGLTLEDSLAELDNEINGLLMVGSLDSIRIADYMRTIIPYVIFTKREELGLMTIVNYLDSLTTEQLKLETDWLNDEKTVEESTKMDNSKIDKLKHSIAIRKKILEARNEKYVDAPKIDFINFKPKESDGSAKFSDTLEKLMSNGEYALAEKIASKLTEKELDLVGNLYLRDGNEKKAEEFFRKAIDKNGEFVVAYLDLVNILMSTDRENEALEVIEKVKAYVPDFDKFKMRFESYRVSALGVVGRYGEALDGLKSIIDSGDATIKIYMVYSSVLFKTGKFREAISVYDKIFSIDKDDRDAKIIFESMIERISNSDKDSLYEMLSLPLDNVIPVLEKLKSKDYVITTILAEAYYTKAVEGYKHDSSVMSYIDNAIELNPNEMRFRNFKIKMLKDEIDEFSSTNMDAITQGNTDVLNRMNEYMANMNAQTDAIKAILIGTREAYFKQLPKLAELKKLKETQ